ncbi:unnamed protein product [Ceratitis capitata]|uniref:(Mediterranean fruit fly) hypothetical protein n=1 Tax=Ceratitis capitata TaxID=7213 RepID=A0A811U2Y3_CERCA|nr:unnamed protein product [Ceratitis capitata]
MAAMRPIESSDVDSQATWLPQISTYATKLTKLAEFGRTANERTNTAEWMVRRRAPCMKTYSEKTEEEIRLFKQKDVSTKRGKLGVLERKISRISSLPFV